MRAPFGLGKVHHPTELMRRLPRCSVCPRGYSTASNAGGVNSHLRIAAFPKQSMSALDRKWITSRCVNQNAA